jgi:predicted  nucleic acid-binding Zn-ribbon protein
MKNVWFIAFVLLTFSACGHRAPEEKAMATDITLAAPPAPALMKQAAYGGNKAEQVSNDNQTSANQMVDTSKKIIKEGDIRFETGDLKTTKEKIVTSLKSLGGYVVEESETNNGDNNRKEYNLKIRVPAKNFDRFLETLSANADRIDTKNIRVKDVTTEYIDITTQLKNKKLLENRYQELLAKATKTADLLDIENKLTEIRSDIESTQGQLNYLNKQVTFSSLDITFYTKQSGQINNGNEFGYKLKTALADGWGILQSLFFTLITLWPVAIIIIIIYWLFKKWRKRRRVKKGE